MINSVPIVYFIEDDPEILESIRRSLYGMRGQWEMDFFVSPRQALEVYQNKPADIIITDMQMSEFHGLNLVFEMMKLDTKGRTAFVFMTNPEDFDDCLTAISELQVFQFLEKPIIRDTFVDTVRKTLLAQVTEKLVGGRNELSRLEDSDVGVFVLTKSAEILYSNPAAKNLISKEIGLVLDPRGLLKASNVRDSGRISDTVVQAVEDVSSRPYWVSVECVEPHQIDIVMMAQGVDEDSRNVMAFAKNGKFLDSHLQKKMTERFGLKDNQLKICAGILKGQSIRDVAIALKADLNSTRGEFKQCMRQLGVARPIDMVKLFLT